MTGLWIAPGSISATCTPHRNCWSSARKPAPAADKANLLIEYGIKKGMGMRPAIELTNSTVPRWRWIMPPQGQLRQRQSAKQVDLENMSYAIDIHLGQ